MKVKLVEARKLKLADKTPREKVDRKKLERLCESIKRFGLIYPLACDENLRVWDKRRFLAIKRLKLKKVPVIIRPFGLKEKLSEELTKEPLSPIEEAKAFKLLIENEGLSIRKLAKVLGIKRGYIEERLDLLKFPKRVQNLVIEGKIPFSILSEIARAPKEKWSYLLRQYLKKKITHRQLRILRRTFKEKGYAYYVEVTKLIKKLVPLLKLDKYKELETETFLKLYSLFEDFIKQANSYWENLREIKPLMEGEEEEEEI